MNRSFLCIALMITLLVSGCGITDSYDSDLPTYSQLPPGQHPQDHQIPDHGWVKLERNGEDTMASEIQCKNDSPYRLRHFVYVERENGSTELLVNGTSFQLTAGDKRIIVYSQAVQSDDRNYSYREGLVNRAVFRASDL